MKIIYPTLILGTEQLFIDDKKVPPRHPLQRLKRLVQFSHEMLDQWFTTVPSKNRWKDKFDQNAIRMKRAFDRVNANTGNQRCGFFDESLEHGGPSPGAPGRRRRQVQYTLPN